jgi:hypothetical protein
MYGARVDIELLCDDGEAETLDLVPYTSVEPPIPHSKVSITNASSHQEHGLCTPYQVEEAVNC